MNPEQVVTRQVRHHFSRHAEEYDRYALVQKKVVGDLLRLLPPDAGSLGPALDIGTGTGELARQLRKRCPEIGLAVADIAHRMTRCAANRLGTTLAFDADAQALPLADNRFGLVLSSSMYQWVNDLFGAFRENFRVLKPGGCFLFALFGENTLEELRTAHSEALARVGHPGQTHMQEFPYRREVREALAGAGFDDLELTVAREIEYHADVPELLRNLKRIGAQNASSRRPAGLGSRRVIQLMMEIYSDRFRRQGKIPATYRVIYGRGRKPA